MKKIYDAVVTVGEYQNKKGETKKNYLNVGTVFENDAGALSLKLNAIPISFSGWINFYVPKEKDSTELESKGNPAASEKPAARPVQNFDNFDDDIPF